MRQTVAVSLPADLTARLDLVAEEEGTSRSEVVRDALRRYLALRQFQKVREAIIPYAEAAGVLTDEDVFRSMS
ncbi:MAG: ribbon-helix-helix protein, CopG family [Deltaproteobacteria bacterium]|nr:ribbon-helix-helix protein, CopG family [Deltaproteobacteria bacterium]